MSAMSEDRATLVVVEELVDSSSGASRAAGCTTSSGKGINVEPDVVVLVLVVVRLARRLPSCLPRSAKTPASFTDPVTTTAVIMTSASPNVEESHRDFITRHLSPRRAFFPQRVALSRSCCYRCFSVFPPFRMNRRATHPPAPSGKKPRFNREFSYYRYLPRTAITVLHLAAID